LFFGLLVMVLELGTEESFFLLLVRSQSGLKEDEFFLYSFF